jgi:Spy/CpxP family protein refolding chaperone
MTTMKLRFLGLGALVAVVSACSGSADTEAPAVDETAVEQPAAAHAKDKAGLPGKLAVVTQALAKLNLKPEQKTEIDKLVSEATARHQAVAKARGTLKDAVAAQLASGTFDRGALSTPIQGLETAVAQTRTADRAALVRLHAVLDAGQRAALADEIEAAFKSKKSARWSKKGGNHHGFKAREWARDLALTEEQVDRIQSAMRDKFEARGEGKRGDRRARFEASRRLLESFRGEKFTLDEGSLPFDGKRDRVGRMLDVLEVAVPTLTPEQRKRAADKLRATEL